MQRMNEKPATVDEYIDQYPPLVRQALSAVRAAIREAVPDAEERISYGMPGYFLGGGVIWFGAYKKHIGLHPRPTSGLDKVLAAEMDQYAGSKGSLHLPLDKPMPVDFIRRVARLRAQENQSRPAER